MESWLLFANLNCPSLRGWDVGAMPATGGRPEGAGLEGRRSFRMAATVGSGVKEARRGEAGGEPSDPHECEEGTTKERKTHPKGAASYKALGAEGSMKSPRKGPWEPDPALKTPEPREPRPSHDLPGQVGARLPLPAPSLQNRSLRREGGGGNQPHPLEAPGFPPQQS